MSGDDAQDLEVRRLLEEVGALRRGHFLLTSGRHSDGYVQCARLFERPEAAERAADLLARRLAPLLREEVDAVAGPALGGVILGYLLARRLGARALYAEREEGALRLRRGFALEPGERVVVAEDVVTTGGSVGELIELARAAGARVLAVAAVADRSGGAVRFDVPAAFGARLDLPSWPAGDCPLCRRGLPVERPGSRHLGAAANGTA
ncbi:MAG: orotate phosphoribosyltransferase [Bacillota bacterium]|nr:orotate phosphoribosyltransferase [Bacillota bacterium]